MLRPSLVFFSLLLSSFAVPASAEDLSSIRIGTDGRFPPWNATGSQGELVGFEIDLGNTLCQRLSVQCKFVAQTWNGMIPALITGRYDAIMAGMAITEEREQSIRFTSCYANEPATFVARNRSSPTGRLTESQKIDLTIRDEQDDLAITQLRQAFTGSIIGVQIASYHEDFVDTFFGDVAEVQVFDTLESLTIGLDAGRIDLAFMARSTVKRLTEGDSGFQLLAIGPAIAGGILGKGVGIGTRIGDDDLRRMFDDAIADAIADGTVARLSRRWFGYDLSC